MTFGQTLQFLRKQKKISIPSLAKEIGISKQTIIDYESDRKLPQLEKLKLISSFFDVSIDYLVYGEKRIFINPIQANNIQTVLNALGIMLNNGILKVYGNISSDKPVTFISKNNILKSYIIDYQKLLNHINGIVTKQEMDKILLILTEKY